MNNIESIFNFYIQNRMNIKEEQGAQKALAAMISLHEYEKEKNFDLSTVLKMILLENLNTEKLTNKEEVHNILNVLENIETIESSIVRKCIEQAKKLDCSGIEKDLNKIYGRLLLSVAIDLESNLKLEFTRLYETLIKLTEKELEEEKEIRLKYQYYKIYDVTKEYAYLISLLEEIIHIKLESQEENNFKTKYEEQKYFYRSMPILSGVLEKTKKL